MMDTKDSSLNLPGQKSSPAAKGYGFRYPAIVPQETELRKRSTSTSYDYTVYITDMPDRHWKLGMDVVRDMAFHPTLDPQELESEKNVIVAELQRGEDDPGSRMFKTLLADTLKGTPYDRPIIGYEKTIRALTTQNLRDYIAKYYHCLLYTSPSPRDA